VSAPPPDDPSVRRGRVRRAPRYGAFTGLGVAAGVVVAVVLTFAFPSGRYSYGAVLGYLAVALGLFGALLGAMAGVLAGIRADRAERARELDRRG
jgi:hypothetical protein